MHTHARERTHTLLLVYSDKRNLPAPGDGSKRKTRQRESEGRGQQEGDGNLWVGDSVKA